MTKKPGLCICVLCYKENSIKIWIDADACPSPVKTILCRAAEKRRMPVILVTNKAIQIPASEYISLLQVATGLDAADDKIVDSVQSGELVITADIPLSARVIEKGAYVLDFRGRLITEESIDERVSIRNFMTELRSAGIETGGPSSFRQRDKQAFADQLDRFLTRCPKPG